MICLSGEGKWHAPSCARSGIATEQTEADRKIRDRWRVDAQKEKSAAFSVAKCDQTRAIPALKLLSLKLCPSNFPPTLPVHR